MPKSDKRHKKDKERDKGDEVESGDADIGGMAEALREIKRYRKIRRRWAKSSRVWYAVHYTLGCLTIALSTFVAAGDLSRQGGPAIRAITPWLLAVCASTLTFLAPEVRAIRYRRASSLLSNLITRWNVDSHTIVEDVADAFLRGDTIINGEPMGLSLASPRKGKSGTPNNIE